MPCKPDAVARSIGEVEPRKDGAPFPAVAVVDASDDIGSNDSTESNTWGHAVIFKGDVPVVIEYLAGIQERCNFEIRSDPGNLRSYQMNTLLDTERHKMLINETINAVSAQIVLPTQRTLFEKRYLSPRSSLADSPARRESRASTHLGTAS